jgi:hypothetical protein
LIGAEAVYAGRDYEPFAIARDARWKPLPCKRSGAMNLVKDQVIFELDEVLTAAGKPYHVFTPYKRAWLGKLNDFYLAAYPVERYLDRLAPAEGAVHCRTGRSRLSSEQSRQLGSLPAQPARKPGLPISSSASRSTRTRATSPPSKARPTSRCICASAPFRSENWPASPICMAAPAPKPGSPN